VRHVLVTALLVASASAGAQELSEEERIAAAEAAYDRGTRAYRAREYGDAGRWYERADELLEADAALIQAVRAYRRADDLLRAATIAEVLVQRGGRRHRRHTRTVLRDAAREGFRLRVECEGCLLRVDDVDERRRVLWLSPDETHRLEARFEYGTRRETVEGGAGERLDLPLEAPSPPPEPEPEPEPATEELAPPRSTEPAPLAASDDDPPFRFSPAVAWIAVGLTAATVGVTVWSALDTRAAADELESNPSLERFDDGDRLERRTNALLGVTVGVAATTAVILALTRWRSDGSEDDARLRFGVHLARRGAGLGLRGAL